MARWVSKQKWIEAGIIEFIRDLYAVKSSEHNVSDLYKFSVLIWLTVVRGQGLDGYILELFLIVVYWEEIQKNGLRPVETTKIH